ncbi:MAG: type II secretion system minor pseudopilin GspK [Sutterellaceae bacterium]|nr:type II secretion system minor pseudopilin GspK [Burkholderiaceae bacterium]MCX7901370.1 type II secretion system minor pseudopilin GspK [Burkholderiaceae bacterium]MDW8429947.1 type II secretion system minor pseudopilin GspK [Sutterellaceae bacterium]
MRQAPTQRGAAVLMALFVAALATTVVTSLFWTQFVLLRTIENQQVASQSRLLLRGALDWARAILRDDAARSNFDALTEPWAQPLAETRLDQLGETSALAAQASLAGSIEDAQARFNLRNLIGPDGAPDTRELQALRRLAALLGVPEQAADLIALRMQQALVPAAGSGERPRATDPKAPPIALVLPQDLFGIEGLDPAAAAKLAPYVAVLDERTPLNVNTAAAETIAARIPQMQLADARALVADRERVGYFRDFGDLRNRLARFGRGDLGSDLSPQEISTTSRYFFVRGQVKLDRAVTRMEALVKRGPPQTSQPIAVLWQREL